MGSGCIGIVAVITAAHRDTKKCRYVQNHATAY